ncbi:hypothetical protein [Flagellimonas baculiformis]|uniref:hypothetical protein n=1 Tax=Flagellimonas baculiformis TaxID=3067310 RepID=UPI00296FC37A|nr:hypothetical protein [Muricauda sp. D6]
MKETLDLETVEDYFENLKLCILELQFCIENIERLIECKSEGLNIKPISNFLSHYVLLSYSHIAINIYKIYKPQEKRSFQKLFNKFKNFRYSESFRNLLTDNSTKDDPNLIKNKTDLLNVISEVENNIIKYEKILNLIITRRQKFYAHIDPNAGMETERLSDLKEIRDLTLKIYNELYGKLFGRYYMFNGIYTLIDEILEDRKFVDEYWKSEERKLEL